MQKKTHKNIGKTGVAILVNQLLFDQSICDKVFHLSKGVLSALESSPRIRTCHLSVGRRATFRSVRLHFVDARSVRPFDFNLSDDQHDSKRADEHESVTNVASSMPASFSSSSAFFPSFPSPSKSPFLVSSRQDSRVASDRLPESSAKNRLIEFRDFVSFLRFILFLAIVFHELELVCEHNLR